jgi:hypothetical protein
VEKYGKVRKATDDNTRWFKYDRDDLCVNKSQFFPVIFEPLCIIRRKGFACWISKVTHTHARVREHTQHMQ